MNSWTKFSQSYQRDEIAHLTSTLTTEVKHLEDMEVPTVDACLRISATAAQLASRVARHFVVKEHLLHDAIGGSPDRGNSA